LGHILFLQPYRIISTGASTGLVQVLPNTISLDALKKTADFTTLNSYFRKVYDSSYALLKAQQHFASSLAAYSLFSYLLQVKDRHNGNILIDAEGHIIHIDFGFLLSIAPGGAFSLENAPFKLTEEMVEVLDGLDSPLFAAFVGAFTKGFLALQSQAETMVGMLQSQAEHSTFPCFIGKQTYVIISRLRDRFRTDLSVVETVKHCLDLIRGSYNAYGTRQYDTFQWYSNGIMP
jgi:phosphatidylinositol kinase/protein kinase (PI-3  family)